MTWRPRIGKRLFHLVRYSELVVIADEKPWSMKTYNNAISILRRAFDFGWGNRPDQYNSARWDSARLATHRVVTIYSLA